MAERELNIIIRAKDKATGVFKKFGTFLASKFVITLGDVTRAFKAITGAIGDVINAATKQEDAINELNEALKQTGQFTPAASKALQENASALQNLTTTGDETILKMSQLLIQFGQVSTDQIPAATKAVLGFAAAQGLDLVGATLLVAKSLGSSTNALTRYGIEIDNSLKGTERFNALIGQMAPLFGSATAQARTFSGRIEQIKNTFGDQLEVIGFAITKNNEFNKSLEELNKTLGETQVAADIASIISGIVSIGVAALKIIPILKNVALNTTLAFAAATGDLELVKQTIGEMRKLAEQRILNAAQDKDFAAIEKERGKEFLERLKVQLSETRRVSALSQLDRLLEEAQLAKAEKRSGDAANIKEAETTREIGLAKSLTEALKTLADARELEQAIKDDPAAAVSAAAEALGIELSATAILADEARIAAKQKAFDFIKTLNDDQLVSDRELLTAQLALDDAKRESTVRGFEATAKVEKALAVQLDKTAAKSVVAKNSVEAIADAAADTAISIKGIATAADTLPPSFAAAALASGNSLAVQIGAGARSASASISALRSEVRALASESRTALNLANLVRAARVGSSNPESSSKGPKQSTFLEAASEQSLN